MLIEGGTPNVLERRFPARSIQLPRSTQKGADRRRMHAASATRRSQAALHSPNLTGSCQAE
jgi:hypothetical protein